MRSSSIFQETTLRFRNAASVRVREVLIESSSIAIALQACRELFGALDRSDTFQANLSRKLWELRASLLYTLMPFDSVELDLAGLLKMIRDDALQIPAANEAVKSLDQGINGLIARPSNPKYLWLKGSIEEANESNESSTTGLVTMMAMGRTFGWPTNAGGCVELPASVQLIDSHKAIASMIFDKVIVLGTCHYLTLRMYSEIFHLGRANGVDVLLYPGERFSLRERLKLPDNAIFRGKLAASRIVHSSDVIRNADDELLVDIDIDNEMKRSMWEMAHGGKSSAEPGLQAARYVLCKDGRGMFVPENTPLLVWAERTNRIDSTSKTVPVEQLAEGNWLVMQLGDTGHLLDLISAEAGFGQKMEKVCDWRPALDALMLTYSTDQIAKEMIANGAQGMSLAQSIRNWADGTVYGPGSQNELRSLLNVLLSHHKLPVQKDIDQYVHDHWIGLKELRGIRLRAGMTLHNSIQPLLAKALSHHELSFENQIVKLENGIQVQLSQVAAVDDQLSWVQESSLLHLKAMRGA